MEAILLSIDDEQRLKKIVGKTPDSDVKRVLRVRGNLNNIKKYITDEGYNSIMDAMIRGGVNSGPLALLKTRDDPITQDDIQQIRNDLGLQPYPFKPRKLGERRKRPPLAQPQAQDEQVRRPPPTLSKQGTIRYDWGDEDDSFLVTEHNPMVNPFTTHYDPKTMRPYDRTRANLFRDVNWATIPDGRPKEIQQEYARRAMDGEHAKAINDLIDITVNKRRRLKYDPDLLSQEGADRYAKRIGGFAKEIDVNPHDGLDEKEMVIFNRYAQPQIINGYSWGQSDVGVQQLYQKTYPMGYDKANKKAVSFNTWKKEQFKTTKRQKPWEPILVDDPNEELWRDLQGRGYNAPRAPPAALPITTIWNKVIGKRMKLWIDSNISLDGDKLPTKPTESQRQAAAAAHMQISENHNWILHCIKEFMSMLQLTSLMFKYYIDSHFYVLMLNAGVGNIKEWKDYKKAIKEEDGNPNRKQYRRFFYKIFVDPQNNGFHWSNENCARAITEQDLACGKDSIYKLIDNWINDPGNEFNLYIQTLAQIAALSKQPKLTQDQRQQLQGLKQTKAYFKKAIRDVFNQKLKEMNDAIEGRIMEGKGEWGPESLKIDELGKLEVGTTTDTSNVIEVTYIKVDIDGETVLEVDKYNFICVINGMDYLASVRENLGLA